MKHLFVPYELALKLKEKGFDEECFYRYNHNGSGSPNPKWDGKLVNNRKWERFADYDDCIAAPLYQQVVDWFREKYSIEIEIASTMEGGYYYYIFTNTEDEERFEDLEYTEKKKLTYYEALTKAIEEAFTLLK